MSDQHTGGIEVEMLVHVTRQLDREAKFLEEVDGWIGENAIQQAKQAIDDSEASELPKSATPKSIVHGASLMTWSWTIGLTLTFLCLAGIALIKLGSEKIPADTSQPNNKNNLAKKPDSKIDEFDHTFRGPDKAPIARVKIRRDGTTVLIKGTVEDENTDTVFLSVKIDKTDKSITVPIIDGAFSASIKVALVNEFIEFQFIDESGLVTKGHADIPF